MPAADREIIDKIIQKLSSIRNRSHFEVLDVDWRADTNEIKRAYISLAKEFHPDRLPSSAPREVRKAAEDLFKLFTLAHDTLVDEKSHAEYLKMFAPPVRRQTQAIGGVSAMLAAEGRYRQGLEYFGRRMYVRAAEIFAEAIGLFEHEAEFHAYLGWSLYLADPDNPASAKKALASLATAIQLNHKLDLAYLFQGYVYKSTGRKDLAEQQFEKAIQCNPDCTEALRELRLISGRK
jgi:DnaJ-class molecular chaperone